MTTRLYRIRSWLHQIPTLLLKIVNALVSWCLWDDAYGMVQCRNAMMQCRQVLVDWVRMCDTRNNIKMTWSNGKSPKFWARSSQRWNWKKSAMKAIWLNILLGNVITTKRHHKEDSMVGCKIMSRYIAFGSPVANCYAQSNSITSEQEKHDNDVNSSLTASSSQ
jgi:hypothetical protein